MLVRWLFPASARLDLVSVNTRSCPAYKKMHPSATRRAREQAASCSKYVNQQAASWSKVGSSRSVPMVLLSLDFGQAMHSTYLDKARVRAVGPSGSQEGHDQRVPGYGGEDLQNDTKSKDKGKRPNQGSIAKRITPPEETRQTPLDHQARRRSRKETFFPSGAKRKSDCPARRQ